MTNHALLSQTTNPEEDVTNCSVSELECTQQEHLEITPVESPGLKNKEEISDNPSKKGALTHIPAEGRGRKQ
jgi:hypothetical protein